MTNRKVTSSASRKKISFLDDLLEELTEKHPQYKKRKKQVKDVIKTAIEFIALEAEKEECLSFEIPFVGHLYKPFIFAAEEKTLDKKRQQALEDQKAKMKWHFDDSNSEGVHLMRPISFKLEKEVYKYYLDTFSKTRIMQNLPLLLAVEEFQNKQFNKIHGQ